MQVRTVHVTSMRGAKREEVSLNSTWLGTHFEEHPLNRHSCGLLGFRMCFHISYQECPRSTSVDWCLTREYDKHD